MTFGNVILYHTVLSVMKDQRKCLFKKTILRRNYENYIVNLKVFLRLVAFLKN